MTLACLGGLTAASPALAAGPPVIEGEPKVEEITETTATIKATIKPEGTKTFVYAEYNGVSTAPVPVEGSEPEQVVSFPLTGLTPGTTYTFHVSAASSEGTVESPAAEFKTPKTPPPNGETPWWQIVSTARPGHLPVGGANEVQEITAKATSGDIVIGPSKGTFFFEHAIVPWNATVAVMQKDLEGIYPTRPLSVRGGEHDTSEFHSWSVTFEHQEVPLMFVNGEFAGFFGGEALKLAGECPSGSGEPCHAETTAVELQKGEESKIVVQAANLGDVEADGEAHTISIADTLPEGVEAVTIEAMANASFTDPEGSTTPVVCSVATLTCTFKGGVPPAALIEVDIGVIVKPGAHGENHVTVSGGGAAHSASLAQPVSVAAEGEATPFGIETWEARPEEEGGGLDTQAGSHPFQTTFVATLNQNGNGGPVSLPKDLISKLPEGLIGNPSAIKTCPLGQFFASPSGCPGDTVVGGAMVTIREPAQFAGLGKEQGHLLLDNVGTFSLPIVNLEPQHGEAARFGFNLSNIAPVFISAHVRTGEDYGVTAGSTNVSQLVGLDGFRLTFWGVPGVEQHNVVRQLAGFGGPLFESEPPPFFSLPTQCATPLHTSLLADSWVNPGLHEYEGHPMGTLDGCNHLSFEPSIKVTPDSEQASKPTGLNVDVHVNQTSVLDGTGLAESNVKDITVALPPGVAVNPSSGDGLAACSEGLVGYEGEKTFPLEPGVTKLAFSHYLPGSITAKEAIVAGEASPESVETLEQGVNFCPNAAKIAEVSIKSPLLPADQPVKGFVYLAAQEANPFGSLLALYIVAEDPISGSLVKLPGETVLCHEAGEDPINAKGEPIPGVRCQALGQIVATFKNNPQLAFEDAELHFFGGERAPLTSPTRCGAYTTQASLVPWSGNESASASTTFNISSGPNGTPCPGAQLPFSPAMTGGATNLQAGEFSPFTATFSRQPGEQNLQSVQVHLPLGMSGDLSNVELCPEPQANAGSCGPNSLIGETTVSVGVGGEPFTVSGGKFYLTGPYNGTGSCTPGTGTPGCAPFGVTFVVPAKAGPFDLAKTQHNHPACDCVLVRGKIEINPETAAITVTSNPPGTPDAIPTSIEGIPLEIQHINATTTRGNFQFNPTNCSKMQFSGAIQSSEGATDSIGVPFQVTNCASLKFEPKVTVSTSGKTSKADGASLTYKVTYPKVPQGTDADIHYVKVELPKALPSRLTTLQKACTAAQFKANPAGCPKESVIGHAKASVPNIPVPLEGPVYFVSNGGEAFPNLVIVLQGYNVTIDLVGDTFISKSGITSTTFKTVPDNPLYSFEINLPEGKYSALAANGNLCTQQGTLKMPNEYIAQNGLPYNANIPISVTGCKKLTPAQLRAQKLKAALKACHKDRNKTKRQQCEKAAHKRYGPLKKKGRK